MKTNLTPQRPAIRAIGLSLLVAGLAAGAIVLAQEPPPEAVPVPPPAEEPAAEDPAPAGPSRTGRIPLPEEGALPAVVPATPQCEVNLSNAGHMKDIISNVLIRAEHKPESEVAAFLKDAEKRYATGDDLLKAAAEHFKIDQKRLAPLVELWRHINCKHAAIPGYVVSDAGPAPSVDPAPAVIVEYQTDPRAKSIIRTENDPNSVTRTIVRTILNEEVSSNPQEAARNYEAVIAAFDSQRANAAQAVFRLGETYRKLNRLDEARVQYARILREFVDFPDLARLSQMQLSQNPPTVASGDGRTGEGSPAGLSPEQFFARAAASSAAERELLHEEIRLLEEQLAETQKLVKSGVASTASLIPIQREILQLKRQLLRLENTRDPAPGAKPATTAPAGDPFGATLRR
jgi:hypothetical protein